MQLGVRLSLAALCTLALTGCGHVAASGNIVDHPTQYIVVLDASGSRPTDALKQDQDFVRQLAKRMSFGDRITLLEMQQQGLMDHSQPWSSTIPARQDVTFESERDKEMLRTKQNGIALVVPGFFKKATRGNILHTDIFATLHLVGEVEQAAGGRQVVLVMLSDMLQSTKGIEMAHASAMPRNGWIGQQKNAGTLPSLDGTCVVVVGADASDAPGTKVRNFWQDYFRATGATLKTDNYLFLPPPEDRPLCR